MKKFMSLLLGAMLILSLIPMSVGATTESWNSFVYYQDGPEFSVEATEFVGAGDYKFIAAAYDANGKLVDMTSSDAAVKAGTLTAAASFEAPGEEADVSIASVKTMLWDSFSGATPIAKEATFAVSPQTVDENGIYSSLTNGFYEAVAAKEGYRNTWKYLSADESGKEVIDSTPAATDSWTLNYWGLNQNFSDNDLTTNCTHGGPADARLVASMLKEASKIDRVVLYSFETRANAEDAPRQKGTEYYLTNSFIHPVITTDSTADDIATANTNVNAYWNSLTVDADNADVYYLGTSKSMAKVATDDDAKLVYDVDSDNSYQYIVGKKSALKGVGGLTQELQAYTKIRNKVIIDAFTASVEYNGLSYSQNGPEFTVKADEVTSNTDLALKATAYNAAGDVVAEVTEPIANPGVEFDINATVNFEEDGEANASIASVETVITDTFGTAVVEDSTFTVTANTCTDGTNTYPMTNGFYQPITTYQNDYRCRYVGGYASWPNGGCVYDGDLTTTEGFASGRLTTGQIHVELSAMTQIDRVVVYNFWSGQSQAGTEFYLSSVTPTGSSNTDEEHLAYYNKFTPDTTVEGIYYLGTQTKAPANVDADGARLVFDVDKNAGTFNRLIARYEKDVNGGYIEEYQAYQKVTATNVVSTQVVTADYETITYNQNGPEFSVTAKGLESNADELMLVATAYNAEGAKLDEKAKVFAVSEATASVNFEENGTEADVNIAKVTVVVKDATGTNVVSRAQDFAITPQSVDESGVYNSFTNGFYKQIIGNDGITATSNLYRWNNGVYDGSWTDANVINNIFDTTNQYTGSNSTRQFQQHITFSAPVVIDRVVAYNVSAYKGTAYYLTKTLDWSTTEVKNNLPASFTGVSTDTITYLGSSATATEVTAAGYTMGRNVFNVGGGTYHYMVVDHPTTASSATRIFDIQAYQKVTASYSYGWAYASVTAGATSHLSRPDEPENVRTDAAGRLTDGDRETEYGQGVADSCSYIFIDLGEAKQLDKVSFYAKDSRTRGIKFWLADTKPMVNADKSTWAYLGEMTVAGTDSATAYHEFVLNENQAGKWQYVVADLTGSGVGGYVQEIEAFAKVPGVPAYESVTANALSYHARVSEPDSARLNANPVLTDGDPETGDGQGVKGACASVFIDLQTETQIDKVSFLVYDSALRTKGAKFYLTNTKPVHNADKSDRVYIGEATKAAGSADADGACYEFELTPEQAGEYRYVMVDLTEVGGYVYEIGAYKTIYVAETVTDDK